jgi:pyrimidine deaminase RibD-like protein
MARAIELARGAQGSTSPNPPVGAVLAHGERIVGEGATQPAGQAHAEIVALAMAGNEARGSELYVTLEPCSYFGRTPPCADALVDAGISAAHVAILDPNPLVNGRGVQRLEADGIPVILGEEACDAAELIEAHTKHIRYHLPFVTLLLQPPPLVAASLLTVTDAVITDLPPPHPSLHPMVVIVPQIGEEATDFDAILRDLGQRGITLCIVTGTPELVDHVLRWRLADKIVAAVDQVAPAGFVLRRTGLEPAPHAIIYPGQQTA